MSTATKYNPQIAWRTIAKDVFQLTRETTNNPATYRLKLSVIDSNEPGAGQVLIGYYLTDYMGVPYSIIATGSGTIDVQDDFRVGRCPTSGKAAFVSKSVFNGRSLGVSQENFQFLHPLALSNAHKYDMALLWANDPNAKKVPFANSAMPIISNYQSDQVDPEDGSKTMNFASDFGETPNVRCVITVDSANRFQRQQNCEMTFVGGLIDTIFFDLGEPLTGYLIISRS